MNLTQETSSATNDRSQQHFSDVINNGLATDAVLAALPAPIREKVSILAAFVGDATVNHGYKTLKAWPTHFPASSPKHSFQLAIDEAVRYIERWMQAPTSSESTARLRLVTE